MVIWLRQTVWYHSPEYYSIECVQHECHHQCEKSLYTIQHTWLKPGLLLCPQTKGVLHYICVSLLIPLYLLCCSQSSDMTSLHLSWQVTVLRQRSTQQGSLNLPTICQSPKTSSVMSSPPRQSRWHIKFVSGNSVGDYNLIQRCPEPMGGPGNYYETEMVM